MVKATSPNGELQFLGFEDGLPLLMKWMGLKVWNLPSITLLDDGLTLLGSPILMLLLGFAAQTLFQMPDLDLKSLD